MENFWWLLAILCVLLFNLAIGELVFKIGKDIVANWNVSKGFCFVHSYFIVIMLVACIAFDVAVFFSFIDSKMWQLMMQPVSTMAANY